MTKGSSAAGGEWRQPSKAKKRQSVHSRKKPPKSSCQKKQHIDRWEGVFEKKFDGYGKAECTTDSSVETGWEKTVKPVPLVVSEGRSLMKQKILSKKDREREGPWKGWEPRITNVPAID